MAAKKKPSKASGDTTRAGGTSPPRPEAVLPAGRVIDLRDPKPDFRLPPDLEGAVTYCQRNKGGATYQALTGLYGTSAAVTLVQLGMLEIEKGNFLYKNSTGAEHWMTTHHKTMGGRSGDHSRPDLRGKPETEALRACERPQDYEAVANICGDSSALFMIDAAFLEWVPSPGERRNILIEGGKAQLRLTDKGKKFLAGWAY